MNKASVIAIAVVASFALITSFQNEKIFKKDGSARIKITFRNLINHEKISLGEASYANPFGEEYSITKLRYYVSNISLEKGNNSFSEKNSFHLIDESEKESQTFTFFVPEGNYSALNFLLGVDSLHNVSGVQAGALDPANDMFWTWNSGYVMFKMEGSSPASNLVNHKFEFHVGGFSGKYNVLKNILLPFPQTRFLSNSTTEIIVEADIDKIWKDPHDIKISERPNIMSPGKFGAMMSDNYAKMFRIEKINRAN